MPHRPLSNQNILVEIPVYTPRPRWKFISLCIPLFIAIITTIVVVASLLKNYEGEVNYGEMSEYIYSDNSLGPSSRNTGLLSRQPASFPITLSPSIVSSFPSSVPLALPPAAISLSESPSEFKTLQSAKPSVVAQVQENPGSSPSLRPSASITKFLSDWPSREERGERHHPELQFYVLGDIPYNRQEQKVFIAQLQEIQNSITNNQDNSRFIVHVGDLMSAHFSKCREERYQTISTIMRLTTEIPILTTPGDNEWNRCPDFSSAVANYTKYFIGIEESWDEGRNSLSTLISRSSSRPENWVLYHSDVLFLAINMVSNVHSDENFESTNKRLMDNLEWFEENCDKYCVDARAIVIFGHSIIGASAFFEEIQKRLLHLNIPIIYFTGNGHNFFVKRGVGRGEISGDFWRVQVDSGIKAPPIKVTIRGNDEVSMVNDGFHKLEEYQTILGSIIKIDRRGGLFFNST